MPCAKPPHDLAYKPLEHGQLGTSVLAVACRDGHVIPLTWSLFSIDLVFSSFLYTYPPDGGPESKSSVRIAPSKTRQSVGAIVWGRGPTSSYLYASSEPELDDEKDHSGAHKAVDVEHSRIVYCLSAKEAGDATAVDEYGDKSFMILVLRVTKLTQFPILGERLALFTRGLGSHILRLYDIKAKNGREPIFSTELEAPDGVNVNCAMFSPDGIYLAAARSDNVVNVYDSRNLERGVLYKFQHQNPEQKAAGYEGYGIVEAQWVTGFDGRRLGLVSGGNDGKTIVP